MGALRCIFEALAPAAIDLSARMLAEADASRATVLATRCQQVQRLRYAPQRAERQYQQVDPENRLIAAELERRWETALRELREAETHLAHDEQHAPVWAIPADLLEALHDLGPRLPELWEQGLFSWTQKTTLLRALIDKVVVHRLGGHRSDRLHVRVVWRGGATTTAVLPIPVSRKTERTAALDQRSHPQRHDQRGKRRKNQVLPLPRQCGNVAAIPGASRRQNYPNGWYCTFRKNL